MRWLGNLQRPALSARVARALALELRAMEFDVDFAPVADIHSNPNNPVIGDRAFGREAAQVARQMQAFIPAMQEQGIIACAKHFPGHGDTHTDSHLELPVVEEDPDRMIQREIVPFQAAIACGVGTIMTAHVLYPGFDEDDPATMSQKILKRLLREKLGFSGILISDDLEMKAALESLKKRMEQTATVREPVHAGQIIHVMGAKGGVGTTTVTITATDASGNSTSCTPRCRHWSWNWRIAGRGSG